MYFLTSAPLYGDEAFEPILIMEKQSLTMSFGTSLTRPLLLESMSSVRQVTKLRHTEAWLNLPVAAVLATLVISAWI